MNSIRIDLPDRIHIVLPKDYANYCKGLPVSVSDDAIVDGLIISWTAQTLTFRGRRGSVSFDRSFIRGFQIRRHERMYNSHLCTLRIVVRDRLAATGDHADSLIVLSGGSADASLLDQIIELITASGAPIEINEK